MSLFKAHAWRNHPLLKVTPSRVLIGLPTGIAMFVAVTIAEETGLLKWNANDDPAKYAFVSAKYPNPEQAALVASIAAGTHTHGGKH